MTDRVVGVRLGPGGPLVFCRTVRDDLARGQRVTVARGGAADETEEGVVAVAPGQIIAASPLDDAPHVLDDIAPSSVDDVEAEITAIPSGVVFLAADGGDIGPADLRQALRLAALPLPDAPPERRRP